MAKKLLTTRGLDSLKPADKRYDVMDSDTRGLGVRVGTTGKRTFIMFTRFPGSSAPIRAQLGEYPAMSLDEARERARHWRNEIRKGIDPRDGERAALVEQARKRENTFRAVAEDFMAWLPKRPKGARHAEQDAREIRRELMDPARNAWLDKPIADVDDTMVAELIRKIAERPLRRIKRDEAGKPVKASDKPIAKRKNYTPVFEWEWEDVPGRTATGAAFNTLGHVKALFKWAAGPSRRGDYGLKVNPLASLTPSECELHTKGDTERDRVLTEDEIRAYWKAASAAAYPLGPYFKMLLLTGQRKSEVSDAQWSEFNFTKRIWTVPAERFKSGQDHIVPISDQLFALLDALPRGEDGDFVFSTTNGKKPINGFSRAKIALDTAMREHLSKFSPYVLHDIRRTMRTRLSGIRQIRTEVAELVIGHSKKGLVRVYDQHKYEDELIEALQLWADALDRIVDPQPPKQADNVVPLRA